jgi:membrane-bound lytic murein transglycosylase A
MMTDGSAVRVGYDGQNGHPYYAIGRELIKRGELSKDEVSLQTIRAWLESHPEGAADLMYKNPSYVFFRVLKDDGPVGGEGLTLTPQRSLAIDRSKLPYGAPLWVDIDPPSASYGPIRRLMVAQDTGGAIVGAVRGDVFWGYGAEAETLAGIMKSQGRYWILLPKGR